MSSAGVIDRVAEALAKQADDTIDGEEDRVFWRSYARAAIEAMREPTDEMEIAGNDALRANGLGDVEGDDSTRCFQAMISAALSTTHNPEEM